MSTAWPVDPASGFLSGEDAREPRGHTLWDRDLNGQQLGSTIHRSPFATTSLSPTFAVAVNIEHAYNAAHRNATKVRVFVWLQRTSGTGEVFFRLRDPSSGTLGTQGGATGTKIRVESTLTLPDNAWALTERSLILECAVANGGAEATMSTDDLAFNLRYEDS